MSHEILIVDDDRLLLKSLSVLLRGAGYVVRTASNGPAAVMSVRERCPDLVLLDVMMPGRNGFDVCRELRAIDSGLVIAFLTALDTPEDELKGLSSGGDVYISKTVPDEILLARISALLRLRAGEDASGGDFNFGGCRVAAEKLQLYCPSMLPRSLTDREVAFLRLLASHPGVVIDRDTILTRLWGADTEVNENRLSVFVYELRKKFGRNGSSLVTVRSTGYAYRPKK